MGVSKMMGERLVLSSNNRIGKNPTIFSSVRFGNVLDSSGSILQIFREQILNKLPLTITDKRMTRFFINLDTAVELCLYAEKNMVGGEIYIKNMASINITDLAIAFSKSSKPSIKYIGTKIGEKLYESLITNEEAERAYMYNGYICVVPESLLSNLSVKQKIKIKDLIKRGFKIKKELRSDENLLSLKGIKKILNSHNVKKTKT